MPVPTASLVAGTSVDEPDVLHLRGELDVFFADTLRARIEEHEALGRRLTIDLRDCSYIDSTILSILVSTARRYESRLSIRVPKNGIVARILEITELDRVLPIANE